jgi:ABC-type taurine transport system ATPase subunit
MLVRLGFAIATAIEPEILLLDEELGAGDARFAVFRLTFFLFLFIIYQTGPALLARECESWTKRPTAASRA